MCSCPFRWTVQRGSIRRALLPQTKFWANFVRGLFENVLLVLTSEAKFIFCSSCQPLAFCSLNFGVPACLRRVSLNFLSLFSKFLNFSPYSFPFENLKTHFLFDSFFPFSKTTFFSLVENSTFPLNLSLHFCKFGFTLFSFPFPLQKFENVTLSAKSLFPFLSPFKTLLFTVENSTLSQNLSPHFCTFGFFAFSLPFPLQTLKMSHYQQKVFFPFWALFKPFSTL